MKALEKDRNRRYATASELAADVRRYLHDDPVLARPPSAIYRIRKLARKYKGQAAAALLVLLSLIGGLIVSWRLYLEAEAASALAETKAREAEQWLERFDLLNLRVALDRARDEAGELVPAWPAQIPAMRTWIDRVQPVLDDAARVRTALAELNAGAPSEDGRVQTLRLVLPPVLDEIAAFEDPDTGLFGRVKRELLWAQSIRRASIDDHRQRWDEAIAAAADHPRYRGLELTPQIGLVPIGADPRSGLLEFGHLRSSQDGSTLPERDESGQLVVTEDMGLVFVLVGRAHFWMGAQAVATDGRNYDPLALETEGPVHEVSLRPYLLSKFEMTQAQWMRLADSQNPSAIPVGAKYGFGQVDGLHPVESVTAARSIEILTRHGLRLPTEAQWEYAARARTDSPWWTGTEFQSLHEVGGANLASQEAEALGEAWPQIRTWPELRDGFPYHAPIGSSQPNAFGFHEVHGNQREWTGDWFQPYLDELQSGDEPAPRGNASKRVIRGGGFSSDYRAARTARRAEAPADFSAYFVGLRPARAIVSP